MIGNEFIIGGAAALAMFPNFAYGGGRMIDKNFVIRGAKVLIPDGTVDTAPEGAGGYESAVWTATFVNLPKYQSGTTISTVAT